jgi:hypothetical protein
MDRATAQLPQTTKGRAHFVLFFLLLATIFIGVLAFQQHLADAQFISGDELKRNVQTLQSYSAEAGLLSQYAANDSSPRPYTVTYAGSLQDGTDSIVKKLQEHPHSRGLDGDVLSCIELAQELSDQLNQLATEPKSQLLGGDNQFHSLSESFQNLGDEL